jgi:hypothetical protein
MPVFGWTKRPMMRSFLKDLVELVGANSSLNDEINPAGADRKTKKTLMLVSEQIRDEAEWEEE